MYLLNPIVRYTIYILKTPMDLRILNFCESPTPPSTPLVLMDGF